MLHDDLIHEIVDYLYYDLPNLVTLCQTCKQCYDVVYPRLVVPHEIWSNITDMSQWSTRYYKRYIDDLYVSRDEYWMTHVQIPFRGDDAVIREFTNTVKDLMRKDYGYTRILFMNGMRVNPILLYSLLLPKGYDIAHMIRNLSDGSNEVIGSWFRILYSRLIEGCVNRFDPIYCRLHDCLMHLIHAYDFTAHVFPVSTPAIIGCVLHWLHDPHGLPHTTYGRERACLDILRTCVQVFYAQMPPHRTSYTDLYNLMTDQMHLMYPGYISLDKGRKTTVTKILDSVITNGVYIFEV